MANVERNFTHMCTSGHRPTWMICLLAASSSPTLTRSSTRFLHLVAAAGDDEDDDDGADAVSLLTGHIHRSRSNASGGKLEMKR
ncbi:ATP synthase subunit alpha [Anopheles sinensis]|uniref:ATP synthase subunit alpha n=1 Tax=Anopheles sinensis TaxID=74873 RepID=A0A084WLZ6_ANOSI|nr:ATP synthase subunit alpha [Anopheles sinensis]